MHKFSFLFKINYKSLRTWISFLGPDKMIFTPVESVKPSSTARLQTWECTLKQSIFRALSYINAHCVGRLVNQNMRWLAIQENTSDDEWSECLYVWCVYQNKIYQSWIWILFFQGSIQCYEDLDQFITPRESDHYSCGLCHQFRHRSTMSVRWHLEAKHFPGCFTHQCHHCDAILPTRRALDSHVKREHCVMWGGQLCDNYLDCDKGLCDKKEKFSRLFVNWVCSYFRVVWIWPFFCFRLQLFYFWGAWPIHQKRKLWVFLWYLSGVSAQVNCKLEKSLRIKTF